MLNRYNLQFFGGESDGDDTVLDNNDGVATDGDNNQQTEVVDLEALAELISDKDKQIQQLQHDMAELKKVNTQLVMRVNAGTVHEKKSFEENLLDVVGYKPRKE